jgi:hypothetical protein
VPLNDMDWLTYLTEALTRILSHPNSDIDQLLPPA